MIFALSNEIANSKMMEIHTSMVQKICSFEYRIDRNTENKGSFLQDVDNRNKCLIKGEL